MAKRNYRGKRNNENLEKCVFQGCGKYGIPKLVPLREYTGCELIPFNQALTAVNREKRGVHFFLDDYQFNRVWNYPDRYTDVLSQFKYCLSPDFSTYTDYPVAMQIYNHYRKHWLGAYLQNYGCSIIPTISWSDEASYEWCFDGEPESSVVAVGSIGIKKSPEAVKLFIAGYREMLKRLRPSTVLFYGDIPKGCEGKIIQIRTFEEKFRE